MKPDEIYQGKISWFGGPDDEGVQEWEGVALYTPEQAEGRSDLFLKGERGLAKRLNPDAMYCACRWDYGVTPRDSLRKATVRVSNILRPELQVDLSPVDWGPAEWTNRIIDVSPAALLKLSVDTDSIVKVILLS